MSYKSALPGMFAVPEALVDEHLKLARVLDLKVLLWILRHGGAGDLHELACQLGRPEEDLADAVQFWIDRGLIAVDNAQCTMHNAQCTMHNAQCTMHNEEKAPAPAAAPLPPAPSPLIPELPLVRPTTGQILTRTEEEPALRSLFQEADRLLKRTIGHEGQCMLLMLKDTCGLPVEVIFMLLQYCADEGKTHINYIEKLGFDWGAKGIDSIEKAGAYITQLKEGKSLWGELCRHAGKDIPKGKNREKLLLRWNGELGFGIDMICLAYDEMADNCSKIEFAYINKILEKWHEAGIKTPAQAEIAKEQFRAKQEKPAPGKAKQESAAGYDPSFDLEAFERSTLRDPVLRGTKNEGGNAS